jgi:hypothetical protein
MQGEPPILSKALPRGSRQVILNDLLYSNNDAQQTDLHFRLAFACLIGSMQEMPFVLPFFKQPLVWLKTLADMKAF